MITRPEPGGALVKPCPPSPQAVHKFYIFVVVKINVFYTKLGYVNNSTENKTKSLKSRERGELKSMTKVY